jgi:hypothetical protein
MGRWRLALGRRHRISAVDEDAGFACYALVASEAPATAADAELRDGRPIRGVATPVRLARESLAEDGEVSSRLLRGFGGCGWTDQHTGQDQGQCSRQHVEIQARSVRVSRSTRTACGPAWKVVEIPN